MTRREKLMRQKVNVIKSKSKTVPLKKLKQLTKMQFNKYN